MVEHKESTPWLDKLYKRHPDYKSEKAYELYITIKPYVNIEKQKSKFATEKKLSDGSIYIGSLNRYKQAHGTGLLIRPDKAIFEGHWLDGKISGKGRLVNSDGSFIEGDWSGDVVIGQCHVMYTDGTEYSGEAIDNTPNGFGRIHWEDGSWYEGNFVKGLKEGSGRMRWSSGK